MNSSALFPSKHGSKEVLQSYDKLDGTSAGVCWPYRAHAGSLPASHTVKPRISPSGPCRGSISRNAMCERMARVCRKTAKEQAVRPFDGEEIQLYPSLRGGCPIAGKVMDTMTYASAAVLPWSVAQDRKYSFAPESDFVPLDLSYINCQKI